MEDLSALEHLFQEYDPLMDECEVAELGMSHEMLADEVYLPSHPSRDWISCYVSTTGPGNYRFYLEGKKKVRFLLSAKQFTEKGPIYISSHEDFPLLDSVPRVGHLARLEKQYDQSYQLCLNQCHLCDHRLGKFTCGRGPKEREVVTRIAFHYKRFRQMEMDFRVMTVNVPAISKLGRRKIWCPRAFRNANPDIANDMDVNQILQYMDPTSLFTFKSKLPEFNQEANSLVVKFQGSRVLVPSSKNFLLSWAGDDTSTISGSVVSSPMPERRHVSASVSSGSATTAVQPYQPDVDLDVVSQTSSTRKSTTSSNGTNKSGSKKKTKPHYARSTASVSSLGGSDSVLQFGKTSPTRFTLDFRYPLSPLQAFGIALASFGTEHSNPYEESGEPIVVKLRSKS